MIVELPHGAWINLEKITLITKVHGNTTVYFGKDDCIELDSLQESRFWEVVNSLKE